MIESGLRNSKTGISLLGLKTATARYNALESVLLEDALKRNEGVLSADGAIIVSTGKFTGRSPKDKHIVREASSEADIWWGGNNPMEPAAFERLKADMYAYLADKDVEVQDLVCGSDPAQAVNVRLVSQFAWHALFTRHLLRRPDRGTLESYMPEFTIVNAPGFRADPERHGCRSETVVAMSFDQKLVLIASTEYAGEIKKSAFTILNHLYPARGIMPMHCSANHAIGNPNDSAIFFGLSGTGKTTLSTDPSRVLIGDDEHGWSDAGVFNFEGGSYAKTIRLSPKSEPGIWKATHSYLSVLENVGFDPDTRMLDLDDDSKTENTRAAFPLHALDSVSPDSRGGTPRNVFLLTCDAFGVTPPIGRLTPEKARELFLLGFTSKVAGTERGVNVPTPTFSTCFGAPFLTREPAVYADMFAERLAQSGANVWLLNTGWTEGDAATGRRMPIAATRALLRAALSGSLDNVATRHDPVWDMQVPIDGPEEARAYLDPARTWADPAKYEAAVTALRAQIDGRLVELGLAEKAADKVA